MNTNAMNKGVKGREAQSIGDRKMKFRMIGGVAAMVLAMGASAQNVDDLAASGKQWLVAQKASQARVDQLDEQSRNADSEYQRLLRQIEGLEAYNRQLKTQIDAQEKEIAVTDASISKATEVDRQLLPLMNNMVDTYAKLVEVSPPFLPAERKERAGFLAETINRADVAAAEKFRQVLDAYMTELSYGNTIEAYNDTIQIDGGEIEVSVLRLGRIGLFYQSPDRVHTGRWNQEAGAWEKLDTQYRNAVYAAIRVANKLTAPSLLSLPLPPPEQADASAAYRAPKAQPTTTDPNATRSTEVALQQGAGQ